MPTGTFYSTVAPVSAVAVYVLGGAAFVPRRVWAWPVVAAASVLTLALFGAVATLTGAEFVC